MSKPIRITYESTRDTVRTRPLRLNIMQRIERFSPVHIDRVTVFHTHNELAELGLLVTKDNREYYIGERDPAFKDLCDRLDFDRRLGPDWYARVDGEGRTLTLRLSD